MSLTEFFKKIKFSLSDKMPFVVYRKPNEDIIHGVFQKNATLFFTDDYTESGFVFAPFDTNKSSVLLPLEESELVEFQIPEKEIKNTTSDFLHDFAAQPDYLNLIDKTVNFINTNAVEKIVISRKEFVKVANISVTEIYERLLYTYKNAMSYVFFHPEIGLWLGATPETLFAIKDNSLTTMALAGTQAYTNSLDVTWQHKETNEQQLVTNYIVEQLKDTVKTLDVSTPYTVKAGNLLHIKTDIKATLQHKKDVKAIISKLHPTPAVCGLPMQLAKEFILQNEGYNRSFYTGFLGELNIKDNTNIYVNLRCMNILNDDVYIFVGGGVTSDSIAFNEWQETIEKSKVIKCVLG